MTSLVLLVAVALFVTANAAEATVNLFWIRKFKATVGMLVIGGLAAGIGFMALIDLVRRFREGREIGRLRKSLAAAEQERRLMKSRIDELTASALKSDSRGPAQ